MTAAKFWNGSTWQLIGAVQGPAGPPGPIGPGAQVRAGQSSLTWPGASAQSNTVNVNTGLTTANIAMVVTADSHSALITEWQAARSGTTGTFTIRAIMPAGLAPAAGYARGFYWIAYGW